MLPDRDEADYGPEEGDAMRSTVCDECRRIDCDGCGTATVEDFELLAEALEKRAVPLTTGQELYELWSGSKSRFWQRMNPASRQAWDGLASEMNSRMFNLAAAYQGEGPRG